MRALLLASLLLPLSGLARAEPAATSSAARPRGLFARALGVVTSTAPQTEPQPLPRPAWNHYARIPAPLLAAELEARHAEGGDVPALVERLTRGFVGAPYLLGALGEGAAPDPDPRFRVDAFDCTTLVETALAVLHRARPGEAARRLDDIRYVGGEVAFDRRRHLVTSQWIPGLVDAGYLEDVTREVGGEHTRRTPFVLDRARWEGRTIARALDLPDDRVPQGTFPLDWIPLDVALERADRIPPGSIMNVVRADWPRAPDLVTHQVLVVTRPGGARRWARHASPVARRVVDEPLAGMLARYLSKARRWPVVGVNVLRIRPPESRP